MGKKESTNLTSKIRSSLVLKLNLRILGRLISSFLAINMLIVLLGFFLILWKTEEDIQYLIDQAIETGERIEDISYRKDRYEILKIWDKFEGKKASKGLTKYLPLKIREGKRGFKISKGDTGFLKKLYSIEYIIIFPLNNKSYQVISYLGRDMKLFSHLLLVLLIFEFIILLRGIRKGSKQVRKTLQPIAELTETAKSLNKGVAGKSSSKSNAQLKDLAGVISGIDAGKLDSLLSVDSSQEELKDLTHEINNMLNRINSSYQSQVQFVSDASHELRTPISVIQGYANLLDRWGKEDENTLEESINAIKSEAENMKNLVEQLLFLARGDNETIRIHMEVFDICDILEEITRESKIIDSGHKFDVNLDRPAYINGDRQLIKQAIRILVDNSKKFTPLGDNISLKIAKEKGGVHIVVQDSGIGIEAEELPLLFNRFYRSDESRARDTGGSGLGLSIAKWIIDQHEGHFEILSRLNIGTRISIIFPKAREGILKENSNLN